MFNLNGLCPAERSNETIKAVRLVKQILEVKTTLGVSNVSFRLPSRQLLNNTFLAMALSNGLDAPMNIVRAYRVLSNLDKEAKLFIESCRPITVVEETLEALCIGHLHCAKGGSMGGLQVLQLVLFIIYCNRLKYNQNT